MPSKNQSAHTTANIFFENVICHYGLPSRINSDQGQNFESKVIRELCKIVDIDKTRTTPYRAQGNGMAVRLKDS